METANAFDITTPLSTADSDGEARAAFDALVRRAWIGDRRALGTIAIAFGGMLLDEARAVVAPRREKAAADVVQDFYVAVMERRGRWPPTQGTTVPWVRVRLREIARGHP
jgi:DNA-directed RNA polymerase specialized sigma24 family protein